MEQTSEVSLRRSLRRWRVATVVCLFLIVGVAAVAIYAIMDQAVTLMYHDTELENMTRREALLEKVALHVSADTTKAQLMELVQEIDPLAFEKEGAIHAEDVGFYFNENGTLACIASRYPREDGPCAPFVKPER
jgi:hypothetical protein